MSCQCLLVESDVTRVGREREEGMMDEKKKGEKRIDERRKK